MSYEINFDANGIYEQMRAASTREIAERLRHRLLEKFGTAPSTEELIHYYNDEDKPELPNYTQEQKSYALIAFLEIQAEEMQELNTHLINRIAKEYSGRYDDEGYPHADD